MKQPPTPRLHIALIEPEIPQNTGNIARLCGATFSSLHLVGKLGFRVDEKAVRRAGLEYWEQVDIRYHREITDLYQSLPGSRFLFVETTGLHNYRNFSYRNEDCLVFGRETKGLPEGLIGENVERSLRIPVPNEKIRSLNLANCVAIVLYEALSQIQGLEG